MSYVAQFEAAIIGDDSLFRGFEGHVINQNVVKSPYLLADKLIRKAIEMIKIDPDKLEEIIAAAKTAYDTYIAPIDIPGIPNIIEPVIDALLWRTIESTIRLLAKNVRK
jgi:hypothetical protein